MAQDFDVDGPADPCDGLFGLPQSVDEAAVRVIPVPWEGTVSSGGGTSAAPQRVLEASWQVDLFHPVWRDGIWPRGVAMEEIDPDFVAWNEAAAADWRPEVVAPLGLQVDRRVQERVRATLDAHRIPAVLGGEHSVALGGMLAATERHPRIGVLQIDAHADLRDGYEGLVRSHASVMHNLLEQAPLLTTLVQVGLRDVGRAECARIQSDPRIRAFFDHVLAEQLCRGTPWSDLVSGILDPLPEQVWVSVDVDGLDPSLCPYTGTPVPGGLDWRQATFLLRQLARSGRRIVGFDVCETGDDAWDANVAARLVYELAGCALSGV